MTKYLFRIKSNNVNRNLTIASGATMSVANAAGNNGHILIIGGNLSNDGTLNLVNGNDETDVTFNEVLRHNLPLPSSHSFTT